MDDYIAKPIRRNELLQTVKKWLIGEADLNQPALYPNLKSDAIDSSAPMNFEKAREEFDGDNEFLLEVMTGFINNVGNQIETIRRAIIDGNSDIVWQEAHSIKGGALNLTAEKLSHLASELERTGKSKNLKGSRDVLNKLKSEYVNLKTYAENYF